MLFIFLYYVYNVLYINILLMRMLCFLLNKGKYSLIRSIRYLDIMRRIPLSFPDQLFKSTELSVKNQKGHPLIEQKTGSERDISRDIKLLRGHKRRLLTGLRCLMCFCIKLGYCYINVQLSDTVGLTFKYQPE